MASTSDLLQLYENLYLDLRHGNFVSATERITIEPALSGWNKDHPGIGSDSMLLKLHAVISSVYDGVGNFDEAAAWIQRQRVDVKSRLEQELLKADRDTATEYTSEERELLFARIWFVLRSAISAYRRSDFHESLSFLDVAEKAAHALIDLDQRVKEEMRWLTMDSTLLLVSVLYWRGCSLVYTTSLNDAEKSFIAALDIIAKEHRSMPADSQYKPEQLSHEEHLSGRILLGLGLAKFRQGALTSAKSHLLAARALLARTYKDVIRVKRAELLLLSVERILTSQNGDSLYNDVIVPMEELLKDFSEHTAYRRRTLWTLAHAYISLADCRWPDKLPDKCLEQAAKYTQDALLLCDSRTLTDLVECLILRARIMRKQGHEKKALGEAEQVLAGRRLNELEVNIHWDHFPFYHTLALIAVGHARLKLGAKSGRREDFEQAALAYNRAINLPHGSALLQAQCHLYLARAYYALRKPALAWQQYGEWGKVKDLVESDIVHNLATSVKNELERGDTFAITAKDIPEKNAYDTLLRDLRIFLIENTEAPTRAEQAKRLGIKPDTLRDWIKKLF
jgi:tetratricopeptide (TPR) repeat protein